MTTEEDFQKALDASPDDWQTRAVFADFLEERGDPRAEGYRALGALKLNPMTPFYQSPGWCAGDNKTYQTDFRYRHCKLPADWHMATRGELAGRRCRRDEFWIEGLTRREAEDAAAIAFAKLPEARRHELLNPREATV